MYDQALTCFFHIVHDISKPSINNPDLEYLPSQLFFEHLRNKFYQEVEGVIYPSIQTSLKGHNIILFPEKSIIPHENSKTALCLDHLFYEEHIKYVGGSIKVHTVKQIKNTFDSYDNIDDFLHGNFDEIKSKRF